MNCYRVELKDTEGSHGFYYVSTKEAAKKIQREHEREGGLGGQEPEALIEHLTVVLTKDGVLKALNRYASHPDNG